MVDKSTTDKSALDFKTVFVQGVPTTCTNELFTEIFSTQGAIKKAYVVRMQSSDPKQSTVGYVTYMTYEDAKAAANSIWGRFQVNGTKLKVKFSRKRPARVKDKKANFTGNDKLSAEQNMNMSILSRMWATKCKIDSKSKSSENTETKEQAPNYCVMISASNQKIPIHALKRMWAEKKLKTPTKMLVDSEDNIFYLIMPSKQDCLKAVTKANGVVVGNHPLKVSLLIDPSSKDFEKSSKKSRIIIRNLSFTCKEEDLISAFEKFGLITDVKIPLTAGGKKRGYGFVQFTHPFEAERAIKQMNMKEIKERTVAVDWAVAKEKFKETTENDEEDDDEAEAENEEEVDEEDGGDEDKEEDDDDDEDEDDSSDESGSENSDDEELETSKSEQKEKKPFDKNFSSDVHEAKTLFLRNLSYDVDDEELSEFITKFGETKYCKVVQNPQTGMSKGCAFVQFLNKDDADKCLEMMNNEDEDVTLRGRRFTAVIAVDRSQSSKIRKEKHDAKKEENDKRNIHLSYEGLIRPGTLAANGLSEIELKKRERIEMKKRAKLKNPEVFVSPHRLCVHNLPRAVTDEKLKEIFMSAVTEEKDSKPRITESRIMRDRETVNQSGVARSLGFGYVKFTKHEHALAALRELNNNPDIFTAAKRPIVEFSLENRKALEAQKLRVKRQKNKLALKSKMKVSGGGGSGDGKPQQQAVFTNKKKTARLERRAKAREAAGVDVKQQTHTLLPALDAGFEPSVGVQKQKKPATPATAMEANNSESESKNRKRKAYEGSAGMLTNGKKVRTMKHFGPKIRKRDKGKVLERLRESKKLNRSKKLQPARRNDMSRKEKKELASMAGTSTRKRGGKSTYADMASEKGFSDLVSKYYKKLSNAV